MPSPFPHLRRLVAVGLRLTTNERGEVLVTTTPPVDENAPPASSALFFPPYCGLRRMDDPVHPLQRLTGPGLVRVAAIHGQNGQPLELSVAPTVAPTTP